MEYSFSKREDMYQRKGVIPFGWKPRENLECEQTWQRTIPYKWAFDWKFMYPWLDFALSTAIESIWSIQ